MQIRYNLVKLDNALAFQVAKQSRALTRFLQDIGYFQASNGWKVKVRSFPGIDMFSNTIYLRGSNSDLDTYVDSVIGVDNDYRDELVATIYSALQEMLRVAIESAEDDEEINYPSYPESTFTKVSSVERISL